MINVSTDERNYDGVYLAKAEIGETTYEEGIMSLSITQTMGSDGLAIGAVNSAYCTVTLFTSDNDFAGKTMKVYAKCRDLEGADWILIGTFYCEQPKRNLNCVEITAYDTVKYLNDQAFVPARGGDVSFATIVTDICTQLGVEFQNNVSTTIKYDESELVGYKLVESLCFVLATQGMNLGCAPNGKLTGITPSVPASGEYNITEGIGNLTIDDNIGKYGTLVCEIANGVITVSVGDGIGKTLHFVSPFMTQGMLQYMSTHMAVFSYYNAEVEVTTGNPFIQCGDVIKVNDKTIVVMSNTMDFYGTVNNTIYSYFNTDEAEQGSESVTDTLEQMPETVVEYLTVNNLTADQIDVSSLFAEDIEYTGSFKSIDEETSNGTALEIKHGMMDIYAANGTSYFHISPSGSSSATGSTLTITGFNGASYIYPMTSILFANEVFEPSKCIWTDLPLRDEITAATRGGFDTPKYRKFGNRVEIQGGVNFTWDGTNNCYVADLPEGYRPTNRVYAETVCGKSSRAWIVITENGYVGIGGVYTHEGGVKTYGTSNWAQINISFYI